MEKLLTDFVLIATTKGRKFFIKVYRNREIVMSGLQNEQSGQIRRKVG